MRQGIGEVPPYDLTDGGDAAEIWLVPNGHSRREVKLSRRNAE